MPACARKEIVREGEVGIYHCVSRCVRRAFLCGNDPLSGQSFEHRRGWVQDRLGVNGELWVESVAQFDRWFRRAVGSADRVSEAATTAGRRWFHGLAHSRTAFG